MVRHSTRPRIRCKIQSSQPKKMIQRILPINPPKPKRPSSILCPKGQMTKAAILKHWRPKGMPIMVKQTSRPPRAHSTARMKPPRINHSRLPIILMKLLYYNLDGKVKKLPRKGFKSKMITLIKGSQYDLYLLYFISSR